MNAQQLKNAILQEAIEGRLVPQDPNDEPASALLERIRGEKERLVKEGKLKKKDLVVNPISEDEIPFDIPDNWEWVRIGDYANKVTDFVASGSFATLRENVKYYSDKEYAILVRTKDFQTNFQTDLVYTDKHGYDFLSNSNLRGGELILPNIGASIGKVFIVPKLDYPMTLAPNTVMIRFYWEDQRDWIYTLFCSTFGKALLNEISSSTAQGKFNKTDFKKLVIPLPPLAEQKRIVAKIEELLPKVEEYGKAQEALDKLNAELPDRLKKSVLQEAIEGRLVPQDPNDEPASALLAKIRQEKEQLVKEGKLKKKDLVVNPISEDEIPFDIPETWEWVRFSDLFWQLTDGTHSTPKYTTSGVPFLSVKDMSSGTLSFANTKYISPEEHSVLSQRCHPQKGDMLLSKVGTTGVPLIIDTEKEFSIFVSLALVKFFPNLIDSKFLLYLINSPLVQIQAADNTRGVGNKNWVLKAISDTIMVLPPLAEQHRIVEKLELLLGEIDKLKK